MDKLLGAAAESGRALNAKFVEEYHSDQMAFGGQESFFKGLDGIIGPPKGPETGVYDPLRRLGVRIPRKLRDAAQ